MPENYSFFKDLKVVELASVLAGPAVGMFFAELGAKVIKIENKTTQGDVTRHWKHPKESTEDHYSAYYHTVNWHKTSLMLDLKDQQDKEIAKKHIRVADIVISNFLPDSEEKLELSYDHVKALNPKVIFGHISAYGANDNRPGFDALMQAETGWMFLNGQADGPPTKMPVALIDLLAAHQLKEGILAAYIHLLKTNEGSKVSVSLFDTAVSTLANQASNFLNLNINPQRKGSLHPNIAPYGEIMQTKNGDQLLLAIGNQKQFESLLDILELSNLKQQEEFSTNKARVKNRKQLFTHLQKSFENFDTTEILSRAKEKKIPLGPINDLKQLFENKAAQKLILEQELEDGKTTKRVKTAIFKISN